MTTSEPVRGHLLIVALVVTAVATTLLHPFVFDGRIPLPTDIESGLLHNKKIWSGELKVQNPLLSDPVCWAFPNYTFGVRAHARDQADTLIPHVLSGLPSTFQSVSSPLYQIRSSRDMLSAFSWGLWLQVVLSGFFFYLLARDLGLGLIPCLVGSVTYQLCGHGIYWLELFHWV